MQWFFLVLFVFYSLNITGFRLGNFVLAESCIRDEPQDIPFWVVYAAAVIIFFVVPDIGKWMLLGYFVLGVVIMFFTTVRYMIWPQTRKINGYNEYFARTHHIIKPSETRLIPDTFHIILLVLLPINLIAMVAYII